MLQGVNPYEYSFSKGFLNHEPSQKKVSQTLLSVVVNVRLDRIRSVCSNRLGGKRAEGAIQPH